MTQDDKTPDTEVQPKARRRTFSASDKHRILAEADQCQRGELGALLRREGLYHSHLSKWRAERDAGQLSDMKRETSVKVGLQAKRLRAGWHNDYLLKVLNS